MKHPKGPALLAVAGGGEAEITAGLLFRLLEDAPRLRPGLVGPRRSRFGRWELEGARAAGTIRDVLERMGDAGCTHAVLCLEDETVARRELESLRLDVAAPAGPADGRLDPMLERCDIVVFDLDERGWSSYNRKTSRLALTYSEGKDHADLVAKGLRLRGGCLELEAVAVGQIGHVRLPVSGGVDLYHVLRAMTCGLCAGLRLDQMARTLCRIGA